MSLMFCLKVGFFFENLLHFFSSNTIFLKLPLSLFMDPEVKMLLDLQWSPSNLFSVGKLKQKLEIHNYF